MIRCYCSNRRSWFLSCFRSSFRRRKTEVYTSGTEAMTTEE
jgi:hypothetical protein